MGVKTVEGLVLSSNLVPVFITLSSHTVIIPQVKYVADHYNGYQANVEYYGEAQYPHEYGPAITFKPSGGYGHPPQPSYH